MTGTLIADVLAAFEEVAQKHQIGWKSMYINFRSCSEEMMVTDVNDAKFRKMVDRFEANFRFMRLKNAKR